MPFPLSDEEIKEKFRDVYGVRELSEDTHWDSIIADSSRAAQNEVRAALTARGYTAPQIESWDRAEEFQTDLALFWTLVKGGTTREYDPTFIAMLDRRAELREVEVLTDGEPEEPDAPAASLGRVKVGRLKSGDDLFTLHTNW